jgi:hypothetical protein
MKEGNMRKMLLLVCMAFVVVACGLQPTETPAPTDPPPVDPCRFEASRDYPIYQFPSTSAAVFGYLAAGDEVLPTHRTANGFYGFDPGVAQAGNVGVFRLRWFLKTSYIPSTGNCGGLPVVLGPMAEICYVVLNADTPLYASDDSSSAVIGNLSEGDHVMQLSSGTSWVNVDLNVGSEQLDLTGWVPRNLVIYQGACMGP